MLFSVTRLGSLPLTRLYQKYVEKRIKKFSGNDNWFSRILQKLESYISPFTIALGRLLGLGTPLTVVLGVKKQYRILFLGVLLSSIIFDGIFLIVGAVVGANTMVKPAGNGSIFPDRINGILSDCFLYPADIKVHEGHGCLPETIKSK